MEDLSFLQASMRVASKKVQYKRNAHLLKKSPRD